MQATALCFVVAFPNTADEELFNLCLAHDLVIDTVDHYENTSLIYAVMSSKINKSDAAT